MKNGKNLSSLKLGILGGGQLGKMLCLAASNWNLNTTVLDPAQDCPASTICTEFIKGNFRQYSDVDALSRKVDIVTIEIEHVNVEALHSLEKSGIDVRPSPEIISVIKDKGLQKNFYRKNDLPTADFFIYEDEAHVREKIHKGEIRVPFVQKLCRGGYDGRGVQVVDSENKLKDLLDGRCVIEDLVDIDRELSVIVARNKLEEMRCFRPVEMVFNHEANLVDYLVSPADISDDLSEKAQSLAERTVKSFDLYGILSVEMFLTKGGEILINEVAPRPHNSGHHTIESCITSQYEQHLRSLFDLPLGSTDIKSPSVMLNLLGAQGHEGPAVYQGLSDCLKVEGASVHLYGKKTTKPFRKMGHVTILDADIESAVEKAHYIKQTLKVTA